MGGRRRDLYLLVVHILGSLTFIDHQNSHALELLQMPTSFAHYTSSVVSFDVFFPKKRTAFLLTTLIVANSTRASKEEIDSCFMLVLLLLVFVVVFRCWK